MADGNTKRSLILAGGGIKVSFQAGVLQVWLDEAGLTFDHVDAASGDVFNFSKKELKVIEPKDMTEDILAACVSLPMWFPPVRIGGDIYIDSVFLSDANIEEAIRRGADELWVIWTVSEKPEWHPGFVAT